ncbi:MAG: CotH kinase family protein [Tidjanibacter sp.]|nr:CotH kinase family protein [Tidjanibacter sp.]
MRRELMKWWLWMLAALSVACAPEPGEDNITEEPEEPPVEEGVVELKSLRVEEEGYTLDFSDEATVYVVVEDAEAVTSTDGFSLVAADSDDEPQNLALRKVEPTEKVGRWRCFVADKGLSKEFVERVRIKVTEGDKVVYTESFSIATRGMDVSLKRVVFLREDNPTLDSDVVMAYDAARRLFEGATNLPLESMELVARFESNAVVSVGGVEQTSGESVVDFSEPVEYVVSGGAGSKTYTVNLVNFTGLPIINIHTDDRGPVTSKEDWKSAKITINGVGHFDDLAESVVNIRGRGNTTWGWPKKPYALKFESKTEVLGMPKHKRWVLLANAMDKTMLRNRMALRISEQTSLAWTPRNEYAELFLNGRHLGTYLVTEQIKVDKNRVNITEMSPSDNEGEALTGGYLFELDFHFDNEKQWRTPRNMPFAIKSPDEDELTAEQFAWAQEYIKNLEALIHSKEFLDPETGYMNYVDRQSFVDYWIIYEVCLNHEIGNPGSVYMHKDRGGLLTAGPIWDFDWGTFSYNVSTWADGKLYLQGTLWYGRMFGDPEFKALAKERWADIYPRLRSLVEFFDQEADYLKWAAVKNFALWNPQDTGGVNGDELLPWSEAVARMRSIYIDRIEDINSLISSW